MRVEVLNKQKDEEEEEEEEEEESHEWMSNDIAVQMDVRIKSISQLPCQWIYVCPR